MKRIMITGVTGFIGRALAVEGVARGHSVFGLGSDSGIGQMPAGLAGEAAMRLPDERLVQNVEAFQPEIVFHCAGSALPAKSLKQPGEDFVSSVPVVQGVLEAIRLGAPGAHFVCLSSAAIYGDPLTLPVSEGARLSPLSPYGFHKWMGELLCQEYAAVYGIRSTSARIFSAFGPGLEKQLLWDAIGKLKGCDEAVFLGSGEETRDFIFIDDLVEALYRLTENESSGHEVFNVASGTEVRISEVVATVARHLGLDSSRWRFSGEEVRGIPSNWRADISRLRALGFEPQCSFDEGVRRTVASALARA
jgi:UDP-glucose 4-epimerase